VKLIVSSAGPGPLALRVMFAGVVTFSESVTTARKTTSSRTTCSDVIPSVLANTRRASAVEALATGTGIDFLNLWKMKSAAG
jgi:hypothetical protein